MKFEMIKKVAALTVLMLMLVAGYAMAEEIETASIPSVVVVEDECEIEAVIEINDYIVPMSDGLTLAAKSAPDADIIPAIVNELDACAVTITNNAQSRVFIGDQITLTANVEGMNGEYTTQWQYQDATGTWHSVEGANEMSYTIDINGENIDYSWRLSVNV